MCDDLVSPDARLGADVTIGHGTRVYPNVTIGAGTTIAEHCVIGQPTGAATELPVTIGENSVIRSHTVIYEGSQLGDRLETGHHVVIRENTVAGTNLRIGNFSDVEGNCDIGDYCRFHGYVHVGKGTTIGHFVWLFSLTTTLNDPLPPSHSALPATIGDGAVLAVGTTVMPGATIGKGAFIPAGSHAAGDIPAGAVIDRNGRVINHVSRLVDFQTGVRHPWMRHFSDAYPPESHERISALLDEVMANRRTLVIEEA